jgi:hypothetical protein
MHIGGAAVRAHVANFIFTLFGAAPSADNGQTFAAPPGGPGVIMQLMANIGTRLIAFGAIGAGQGLHTSDDWGATWQARQLIALAVCAGLFVDPDTNHCLIGIQGALPFYSPDAGTTWANTVGLPVVAPGAGMYFTRNPDGGWYAANGVTLYFSPDGINFAPRNVFPGIASGLISVLQ